MLEFGSGASTVWLARRASSVHSVEHDDFWAGRVRDMLGRTPGLRGTPQLHVPAVPGSPAPVVPSGAPSGRGLDFEAYVDLPAGLGTTFDLVLVDGRAREESLLRALPLLAPDGLALLDDSQRARYQPTLRRLAEQGWRVETDPRRHALPALPARDHADQRRRHRHRTDRPGMRRPRPDPAAADGARPRRRCRRRGVGGVPPPRRGRRRPADPGAGGAAAVGRGHRWSASPSPPRCGGPGSRPSAATCRCSPRTAVFYLTQSAKYLPGGLWPLAAQAAVSRRFGVPVGAMVTASSLFMLTHVVSGAAVGLALLGSTSNEYVAASAQVVALAGLLALTPPGVRLARGPGPPPARAGLPSPAPSGGATARALGLMLGAWLCYGVALVLVARGAGAPEVGLLLGHGACATGLDGRLPGPGGARRRRGAGVRGGGRPAGAPGTAEGTALVVAVVSRALFTLVDIGPGPGLRSASWGAWRSGPAAGAAGEETPTQGPAAGRAAREDGSPAEDLRGA